MAFDPYSRPPDRLNEIEPVIAAAAFSVGAGSGENIGPLDGAAGSRMVPFVPGRPFLVAENTKSQVLSVTVQNNLYQVFFGRFAGSPDKLSDQFAPFSFNGVLAIRTLRQLLLPKEQLWAVMDATVAPPTPTHLIVMEVTP